MKDIYEKIYNKLHKSSKKMINNRIFLLDSKIYQSHDLYNEFNDMMELYNIKNIKNKLVKNYKFLEFCNIIIINNNNLLLLNDDIKSIITDSINCNLYNIDNNVENKCNYIIDRMQNQFFKYV